MHLLGLTFRFQLSSGKTILSAAFRVKSNRPYEFQKRNQFFICAYNETRSIAMGVRSPDRSPSESTACRWIPSIIETRSPSRPHSLLPSSLYLDHSHCLVLAPATLAALPSTRAIPDRDVFYVARPARSIPKFTEPEKTFLCMDLSRWTRTQNR